MNIANNGRIAVAVLDFAATGTSVVTLDGNIATNTWNPATTLSNLSSGDSSGVVALVSFGDGTIRAAARSSGTAAWGATQTINGAVSCGSLGPTCSGPLAASINNQGHAVVIFATSDPLFTSFSIFAASE